MSGAHFADRLIERCRERHSQVVVGLDPRFERLPAEIVGPAVEKFGSEPKAVAGAFIAFNQMVIDAVADVAVAVKPQAAFYERYGCWGMSAYAATVQYAHEHDLLVIGDVKRGDIASTAAAYAAGHVGGVGEDVPRSDDFVVDAVTVNTYLGEDGVKPFLEAGGGAFALVKTSNPSSVDVQDVDCGGAPLYERVARLVEGWGRPYRGRSGYSALGAVAGATFPAELARLRGLMPHAVLLVPGYGAQGGGVRDVLGAFDEAGEGALISASRSVMFAWQTPPYDERFGEQHWPEAVRTAAEQMRASIWDATH